MSYTTAEERMHLRIMIPSSQGPNPKSEHRMDAVIITLDPYLPSAIADQQSPLRLVLDAALF